MKKKDLQAFLWKIQNEGFEYAVENYFPRNQEETPIDDARMDYFIAKEKIENTLKKECEKYKLNYEAETTGVYDDEEDDLDESDED